KLDRVRAEQLDDERHPQRRKTARGHLNIGSDGCGHRESNENRYGASRAYAFWTTSAVTMPNMPCIDSACGRMWQWNAQVPGLLHFTMTSQRSPGATLRVTTFHGAATGRPP